MDRCILLVSGSLRAASTNAAALRTAGRLAPADVETVVYDGLGSLPAFNPDLEDDPPAAVVALRREIHEASGLLFCVPEYAGALPGACKNLLDWTIGDQATGSLYEKPVAWLNVSPRGARGADAELRTVLGYAHALIVEAACLEAPVTGAMVGADGEVDDPSVRRGIARALEALVAATA